MLRKLSVSNLAVVEKAETEFSPGLTVITGETGAGKSVLMGAIELVLGSRADATLVRDGAKEAEVVADFGGTLVRRVVSASGHSRAWINDEAASVSDLKALGKTLIDVHGPRANQNLLDESFQRRTLDAYGKVDLSGYAAAWSALGEIRGKIAALKSLDMSEDALDLLRFQVGELSEADLSSDDEDLAERHAAAAHAEEIVSSANEITDTLGGDGRSVTGLLASLRPTLASVARHLPQAAEWLSEAEDLTVRAEELSRSVADAVSRLEVDPRAFAAMDARLSVVNRLRRKYLKQGGTIGDLLRILETKKAKLADLEGRDEKLQELRAAEALRLRAVEAAGKALSSARRAAGGKLAKAVTKELRDLGFLQAKFDVRLDPIAPEATGCDKTSYLFEPNPGESARLLADIASSGEIARVMLAVKSVLADLGEVETMVFDEIDANIGGEVGLVVGEKMRALAKRHQVVAITHLPQSAVFGDRHLVVSKTVSGGRTRTGIEVVEGEARVKEIARMLGGEKLTSVVGRHAKELLVLSGMKEKENG